MPTFQDGDRVGISDQAKYYYLAGRSIADHQVLGQIGIIFKQGTRMRSEMMKGKKKSPVEQLSPHGTHYNVAIEGKSSIVTIHEDYLTKL